MKKIIYITCICLFISLTGCGNKNTLSCTKSISDENIQSMNSTQKVEMKFEKNQLITYTTSVDITLADTYLNYIDEMYANLKQQYGVIQDEAGVHFESNKNGGNLSSTMTINVKEISEETRKFLNIPEEQTKDKMKSYFEEMEYTCK